MIPSVIAGPAEVIVHRKKIERMVDIFLIFVFKISSGQKAFPISLFLLTFSGFLSFSHKEVNV
jgi:hypothetical protein